MTKTMSFVVAAAIGLCGASFLTLPALAQPVFCSGPSSDTLDPINEDAGHFAIRLRDAGISASGVESFGGCIRAYVTGSDGTTQMVYFDPETLQRLQ
ncbi:MAG: hypothetical protein JWN11_535 [Hyphomicrobiales bacterium]|nr:hypothetical protein [Hyphomicrobiales bacterium]